MIRAQCLAHLGHNREAVEVTQQVLRASSDDPEILYAASLVYALAGDRSSALVNADHALKKGTQPRWFTLPAFGSLRDDPELKGLLRRAGSPASAADQSTVTAACVAWTVLDRSAGGRQP